MFCGYGVTESRTRSHITLSLVLNNYTLYKELFKVNSTSVDILKFRRKRILSQFSFRNFIVPLLVLDPNKHFCRRLSPGLNYTKLLRHGEIFMLVFPGRTG